MDITEVSDPASLAAKEEDIADFFGTLKFEGMGRRTIDVAQVSYTT